MLLAPGWARAWSARGLPRPAAEALAVPVAAQLVCAPVVVLLSGQVSLVAVAGEPPRRPGRRAGDGSRGARDRCRAAERRAASLLAAAAGVPVGWLVLVADPVRRSARGRGRLARVGGAARHCLAAVLVVAVVVARVLSRRPLAAAGATVALGVALVVPATSPGWPPDGWVLAVCDVGQGDALVIAVSPGTAVVVDAGPDPPAIDRCLRRLGVRRVPIVLLTHLHADHVEGLPGVLRGRRVGEVATSGYDEPAGELARVRRWTERADVPLTTVLDRRAGCRWGRSAGRCCGRPG